jgi:hypothetical protein
MFITSSKAAWERAMSRVKSNQERVHPMNRPEVVARRAQTIQARMEREPEFKAMYQEFARAAQAKSLTPEANAKRAATLKAAWTPEMRQKARDRAMAKADAVRKAWTPEMREQARQRQREYQERVRLALAAAGDVKLST